MHQSLILLDTEGLEKFGHRLLGAYLVSGFHKIPIFVNEKGKTGDTVYLLHVHHLLSPGAMHIGHSMVYIREEGKV